MERKFKGLVNEHNIEERQKLAEGILYYLDWIEDDLLPDDEPENWACHNIRYLLFGESERK